MTDTPLSNGNDRDPWSATTQDLYEALMAYRKANEPAVVATIVDVEGSAYRRPGAKMVIDPGNDSLGAITAGCLEGPVTSLAAQVLDDGAPLVETFDLTDDDEWGLGLGCNGVIDILLEPLDASWGPALSALSDGRPIATVTVTDPSDTALAVGDRVLVDEAGTGQEAADRAALPGDVVAAVRSVLEDLQPNAESASVTVETGDGAATLFIDWMTPSPDLLLFGSQNDIHPVSRLAREVGFRVIVASARGARSDAKQFPHAHEVRMTRPMELADAVDDPERTYGVLMSHNLLEDRLALTSLLETEVPYIGLMGPRKRFDELRDALTAEEDRELTEAELERIATPVGLDIGSGEPIHIALSVVAEALAAHHGREGGRLTDRAGPIHARLDLSP
ncbi:XdhC family protein [Natrinema gelatinilyticum]|uniref:XdhC family protein n=1 Tax=Natrinema gelatinilyticum TaxID=2961571 RepID=UPI0020C5994C|nr:XdhC family protein [Natrinema gelatinilyticum]